MRALKTLMALSVVALAIVLATSTQNTAEAMPTVTVQVVDAYGHVVPGIVPPRVIMDYGNTIPESTNWKKLITFRGTEFATRLVAAGGYVDAGFADTTGLVFTLDVPAGISGGSSVETEDILIKVTSVFVFGPPDAGTSTTQLDVGISGTTEKYAKDVSMLTAARTVGSASIIYRQPIGSSGTTDGGIVVTSIRNIDPSPLTYRLTFTQSAKNLTTVTSGRVDVFSKLGNIVEAN